jgi:ABC-type sugar transport system ATPase subunit
MIALEDVSVRAGKFTLSGVSFEIPTGGYGVLMGRTACGKTTILETICGLKRAEAGRILLDGRDITRLKAAERGIGYVPQDGALFSTMSVREHLGFALDVRCWPRPRTEARVAELAELLGIGHLLDRKPHGLSGGERQRVALGRALSAQPGSLCLDEPLSALDEDTREEMYGLLRSVCRETGVTTLHVTHSKTEAMELADRIFRVQKGRVHDHSHLVSDRGTD